MAVTYGFYNSIDHDRTYNAAQISSIFDGIINDGVFMSIGTALQVTPGTGLAVVVGIGRAWFNHTWTYNDAPLNVGIDIPDLVFPRIDVVVLEINATDAVRANSIKIVKGTPASTPAVPDLTNTSTIHQYTLAQILVPVGISEFTAAHITNKVGSSLCPFITGILSTLNTDGLVAQWEQEFSDWFDAMKDQLTTDAAGNLQTQINSKALDAIKTQYLEHWGMGFSANPPVISRFPPFGARMQVGADYVHGAGPGEVVITFPIPFSGWPLIFVSAINLTGATGATPISWHIRNISETGFTAVCTEHITNSPFHTASGLKTINWLAIGPA